MISAGNWLFVAVLKNQNVQMALKCGTLIKCATSG